MHKSADNKTMMFKFSFGGFFVKKIILSVLLFGFSLLILSCLNGFTSGEDEPVTSVTIEAPDFYSSSYNGTSMDEETMKLYYSYAEVPEGKDPTTLLDIRPMIYGVPNPNTEETFSNIIVSTTKEYTEIEKTGIDTSIWDFWVDSKDNWKFEANANYNVSFEAKSSVADSIVLVELKDSAKTLRGANICPKLTEEYQSFSFETGSYDKEWNGHLQIALGFFEGKISIKNLKIEKTEKTSLPIGIYLIVIRNPFLGPSKQCFGHQIEIYRSAVFQSQKGFDNGPFIGGYNLEQIFLMADVVSGFLECNSLYNERGGFIQSPQNIFALFMQHIVNTSVVHVAGTDFDRSVHGTFVNNCHHLIKASLDWGGVMAKLEQVGRLPIHDFLFARKETTNQFSVGQGIQHCVIRLNVCGRQFIKNCNNINVTCFCCLASAITSLQTNKQYTAAKGLI